MPNQRNNVWSLEPGEKRRPGVVRGVVSIVLLGLGLGITMLSPFSPVFRVPGGRFFGTYFAPATAVQVVGGMWFGMWGVIAGTLFPVVEGFIKGQLVTANLLLIPANILQSLAPVWAFRHWKLDPRLTSPTDWVVFILVTGLLMTIPAAIWSAAVYWVFGLASGSWKPFVYIVISDAIGNGVPAVVLGAILLKTLSGVVIRSKAFCKGWWA